MRRTGYVVAAVLVAAGLAALANWWFMGTSPAPPPDADETPAPDVVEYLASEGFGELPVATRADYVEDLRSQSPERIVEMLRAANDSPETVRRLRENLRRAFMELALRDAREYAALPLRQRGAYIDRKLDEMERLVKTMRASMSEAEREKFAPVWRREKPSAELIQRRLQKMLSESTPEDRAYAEQYFKDVAARAMKRGFVRAMGFNQ